MINLNNKINSIEKRTFYFTLLIISIWYLIFGLDLINEPYIWDDLHWGWMKNASVNPVNGKKRKMVSYRKDDFHFGNETLVEHMPLQVEKIRDITASTIYASKKMYTFDYDNPFEIGVKE